MTLSLLAETGALGAVQNILLGLFILLSLVLTIFVLFRQTDSSGLAAAFGGGSVGGDGAFGAKTQKVADKVIGWMCALFILLSLLLAALYSGRQLVNTGAGDTPAQESPKES